MKRASPSAVVIPGFSELASEDIEPPVFDVITHIPTLIPKSSIIRELYGEGLRGYHDKICSNKGRII